MNILRSRKFVMGVAALLAASPFGFAQTTTSQSSDQEDDTLTLQKFEVTGSRLTGAAIQGIVPIISYDKQQIAMSPATTVTEYLRDLPITGGADTQSSNFTNGTDGSARVGLRTLGGGYTLILVNGRRITPAGAGATPDLNLVPLAAVKRIEITKAGGSTIYGTSAVSGVINFIMDDEFEGLEVNLGYGDTTRKDDTHVATANFLVGGKSEDGKLRFTVGGSWRREAAMFAPDREYAVGGGVSFTSNPGRFRFGPNVDAAIISANGYTNAQLYGDDYDINVYGWTLKDGVSVATGPQDFTPFVGLAPYETDDQGRHGSMFPFENYTVMVNPNEQRSFYGTANYKLSEKVEFFSEMGYSASDLSFFLAPSPAGTYSIPTGNYYYNQIFGAAATSDAALSQTSANRPQGNYRHVELGPRINSVDTQSVRLVAGFNANLTENWNLEAYYLRSTMTRNDSELNGASNAAIQSLLARTDASAYNLFAASYLLENTLGGGMPNPDAPVSALGDLVRADNNTEVESQTDIIDFRLHGAELFMLPAGPLEGVFGAEFRRQYALEKPDALKLTGSVGWNSADGKTEGRREVSGYYAQFGVPVLDNLSVDLSARYEKYAEEFSTTVSGARIKYQPIADLTLTAGYNQAFAAPDLTDVYNPGFGSFPELNDPFYGASDARRLYQVETSYVGSKVTGVALKPEKSEIYNVGAVYSPKGIKGLDIGIDWISIDTRDKIVYSVQGLLTEFRNSYTNGGNGSNTHPPSTSPYLSTNGGPFVYDASSPTPVLQILGAGPRNVAGERLQAYDLDITYDFETATLGHFNIAYQGTYTAIWEQQSPTTGNWNNFIGDYDGDVAYPRYKHGLTFTQKYGDWIGSVVWHYTASTKDINIDDDPTSPGYDPSAKFEVEAHQEFDVTVSYKPDFLTKGLRETTITVGVNNILNTNPPVMTTAFSNNYLERNFDPRGAFYFLRLQQKF